MLLYMAPCTTDIYYDIWHHFGQYSTLCHILVRWTGTTVKPLTFTMVYIFFGPVQLQYHVVGYGSIFLDIYHGNTNHGTMVY